MTDRTVVITGASRGIGRAAAVAFAAPGTHVVVHGRDSDACATTVAAVRDGGADATLFLGDLGDAEVCDALVAEAVQETGRLDVLVNNAGANHFYGVREATLAQWQQCIDVDLRAAWLCARAAAGVMRNPGAIVNVGSNHAASTLRGTFPYNVAKAGLEALTQSLAVDLADLGIRANCIRPGYVDTEINDAYFGSFEDSAGARRRAESLHLTGRLATTQEIAAAIVFLADPVLSGATTGIVLTIDGGRSALLEDPSITGASS